MKIIDIKFRSFILIFINKLSFLWKINWKFLELKKKFCDCWKYLFLRKRFGFFLFYFIMNKIIKVIWFIIEVRVLN